MLETYIVEKHMKRPTTCANIVSKFEVFEECNYQVLSNFRNIASLRFLDTTCDFFSAAEPLCSRLFFSDQ